MAEKTEDALGGIAAPKAEEAKSAAKTYETPLKEAYEAGDLPAPESAVGGTGNGSGVRPADPNGPEERIARLRRQSASRTRHMRFSRHSPRASPLSVRTWAEYPSWYVRVKRASWLKPTMRQDSQMQSVGVRRWPPILRLTPR